MQAGNCLLLHAMHAVRPACHAVESISLWSRVENCWRVKDPAAAIAEAAACRAFPSATPQAWLLWQPHPCMAMSWHSGIHAMISMDGTPVGTAESMSACP